MNEFSVRPETIWNLEGRKKEQKLIKKLTMSLMGISKGFLTTQNIL
jgi:hypothetical protein